MTLITKIIQLVQTFQTQTFQTVRRRLHRFAVFTFTLFLIACVHQLPTSINKTNLGAGPLANPVIQIDGSIAPNDVLQAADLEPSHFEPKHNAVLITPAGAVNLRGDRIVKVFNRLSQNEAKEQSTVTVLNSDGSLLASRELEWLVGPVEFSLDGSRIITSGSDRTTRIWDNQLNQIASFDGHQAPVQRLKISPDGDHILTIESPDIMPSGQSGDSITVGRLLDLQAVQLASFKGLQNAHMEFSPDGQKLLAVMNGAVKMVDLQGNLQHVFHENLQEFQIASFSPDGRSVLAAGLGKMKLWNSQEQLKAEFYNWTLGSNEAISSIYLGNDHDVVTGSSTGILRFWNARTNQIVTVKAHGGAIHAIAISPDGTQIATLGEKQANAVGDSHIRVWSRQGELLEILEDDSLTVSRKSQLNQLTGSFLLQFTPDGTQIIASESGQIGTTL
ncbi:MAG: hypothetical protein SNJ57_19950 [Cyanobacteriota bacterium]